MAYEEANDIIHALIVMVHIVLKWRQDLTKSLFARNLHSTQEHVHLKLLFQDVITYLKDTMRRGIVIPKFC